MKKRMYALSAALALTGFLGGGCILLRQPLMKT